MKNILYIALFGFFFSLTSCNIDEVPNPNGPSIEGVLLDATKSQLQTLVTGSEELLRQEIGFYYDVASIIGREYYFFTGSDPRYTGELLGKGESQLDNAGFYGTRPYFGRYRTVKNLNVLIEAAENSSVLTPEELSGYLGFAKTFQAYELHLVANLQFQNGIRVDVVDDQNLGPFLDYDAALAAISALLDEANSDLAGSTFSFNLSSAMAGFDSPETFAQFNRAIAARVAMYRGDNAGARALLGDSFMDMSGDLSQGPGRFYSNAGGDFANNLFRVPDQADAIIAHPSFLADAEAGDTRLGKVLARPSGTLALDDLSGDNDVWVFRSMTDPVPYINNEELVLLMAEASIGSSADDAINALNIIRANAGLGDYAGGTSDGEIVQDLVQQKRYSLFGLGHRWVDLRRWGMLDQLPIDRAGDDVWVQMPRPVSEN
jgi:hypothetical protein